MKSVATIILNRNLPTITDNLFEHLTRYDGDLTDIYVLEAGSNSENLSKYATWHADWPEAVNHGLRFNRGMNFALSELYKCNIFSNYQAFFLLTNDTELPSSSTLGPLLDVLHAHEHVGILSPCSSKWGERQLLEKESTKYFWFIHNTAYLLRREFIELIYSPLEDPVTGFLFDGSNFRGYGSEHELLAKAYANDFAAAITNVVFVEENESLLRQHQLIIKTESYERNLELYLSEGLLWMRRKYGFNSHWTMQQYVKLFYDKFFDFHPELIRYKI